MVNLRSLQPEVPPSDPGLRPYTRGGKGYYDELKAILAECGQHILADYQALKAEYTKMTVYEVARLAVRYNLNLKATFEWLEENHLLRAGTYERLRDGAAWRVRDVIAEARKRETLV